MLTVKLTRHDIILTSTTLTDFCIDHGAKGFFHFVIIINVFPLHLNYTFLKGLAQAKIIKKSVIFFRVLNMTI